VVLAASLCACGGAEMPDDHAQEGSPSMSQGADDLVSCRSIQWWTGYWITSNVKTGYGWWDTDLAINGSTPIQLRHASKLVASGVYGWGWMPTFVDQVTGKRFRFLHLRPQHMWATVIGKVYPAGAVIGVSGGDTWDTGGAGRGYSTGPHLCVQTLSGFRAAFPASRDSCH
jgi:hypothetical protein